MTMPFPSLLWSLEIFGLMAKGYAMLKDAVNHHLQANEALSALYCHREEHGQAKL